MTAAQKGFGELAWLTTRPERWQASWGLWLAQRRCPHSRLEPGHHSWWCRDCGRWWDD